MARIIDYDVTAVAGSSTPGAQTIRETHHIVTDVPVTLEWISRHRLTPKLNDACRAHPGFYWASVDPNRRGRLEWEIDVSATPFQFPDVADSPLARPAGISIDSEELTEPTLFDRKGRPLVNTAGEWLAGQTRTRVRLIYRVKKNLAADPVWLDTYPGAVNADAVRLRGRVRPKNTLMLRRVSLGDYQKENNTWFTPCEFELHYDPLTWIERVWNRGTVKLVQFTTEAGKKAYRQERIVSGTPPQAIDEPVPLDARGQPLEGVLDPKGETPIDFRKMIVLNVETQPLLPFTGVLPIV